MSNKRIIYTDPRTGVAAVVVPAPGVAIEQCLGTIPTEEKLMPDLDVDGNPTGTNSPQEVRVVFEVVEVADIPSDRTFRDSWEHDTTPAPEKIKANMGKARAIAHEKRRAKRTIDFAPLDIEATIPSKQTEAESKRQVVRDKDALAQVNIDAANTEAELKAELVEYGAVL